MIQVCLWNLNIRPWCKPRGCIELNYHSFVVSGGIEYHSHHWDWVIDQCVLFRDVFEVRFPSQGGVCHVSAF